MSEEFLSEHINDKSTLDEEEKERKRLKKERKQLKKEKRKIKEYEKKKKKNKEEKNKNISMVQRKIEKGNKRIIKEYLSIVEDQTMRADIIMVGEDITMYKIRFTPQGGHYGGQTMIIELKTKHPAQPQGYPYKQPLVKMLTPVWHVNISNSGSICVDFLTDSSKWMPSYGFGAIVTAIQLLFEEPNPSSPYNSQAAAMFRQAKAKNNFTKFDFTTKAYYISKIKSNGYKILESFNLEYKNQHPDRSPVGL